MNLRSSIRLLAIAFACVAAMACTSTPTSTGPPVSAAWRLAEPVTPTSTSVHLIVTEPCSGGQSADGRIGDPIVDYGVGTIWITVPVSGHAAQALTECFKTDLEYPVDVDLVQPIGDRQLANGSDEGVRLDVPPNQSPDPSHRPLPTRL